MKKIILFLLLLNISRVIVSAETIYGEYYKVDSVSNYIEDEIKVESYNVYNTYRLEYEDMGYIEDNDLYIKDKNDYIIKNYDYNVLINTSSKYESINSLVIGDLNMHSKYMN